MKFTIHPPIANCKARLGCLHNFQRMPELVLDTPLCMLHTRRGSVPHLTKDVFKMLTNETHLMSASLPSSIMMSEFVKDFDSFADFISMKDYPFFMSVQDPLEAIIPGHQKKCSVSIWTRNGRFTVTPESYMSMMEIFKPDMYMSLCDGDTDNQSSCKRVIKAVGSRFLGVVEGGYNLSEREKSVKSLLGKPILGYVIDGLHRSGIDVEKLGIDEIKSVVQYTVDSMPSHQLRVMMGSWNPITILNLVEMGIDVFDSSYPALMTENYKALSFLCDDCGQDRDCGLIDLRQKSFADDFTPICISCSCLACKNHSKAYIHHLIQTKELLSYVLIMLHNMHHYIQFFSNIREEINNGTFDVYKNRIVCTFSNSIQNS